MYNKINKQNYLIIISFIFLTYLSVFVLFRTHILYGASDMEFHIRRIIGIIASYNHHDLFNPFSFTYFHGAAVKAFYPYINLLPIIIFSWFTKSYINIIYLFIAFNTFISLIISFYSSKTISNSVSISYLFSVSYTLSSIFMAYAFDNMDLGALTTLSFLPLVIFGFLSLLYDLDKKWVMLPFGMSLIIYSHVLSILVVVGLLIIWLLMNIKLINKNIIIHIIYSIIITMCLTVIVWLPMFNIVFHNMYNIEPVGSTTFQDFDLLKVIELSCFDIPNFYMSVLALVGLFLSLILYKRLNRFTKQMLWISIIILIGFSNLIPWRIISSFSVFKLIGLFQFSYRFCIISQVFLCYLFSYSVIFILNKITDKRVKYMVFITLVLLIAGLQILNQQLIVSKRTTMKTFNRSLITKRLINTTNKFTILQNKGHLKQTNIHFKLVNIKASNLKLRNNKQIKAFCDRNVSVMDADYFPVNAIAKYGQVSDNKGNIGKHKYINISSKRCNEFTFINKRYIKKIELPLMIYKNEPLHLYLDNHLVPYNSNRNSLIVLKGIKPGKHQINIRFIYSNWIILIEVSLTLIGTIGLLYPVINKHNKNKEIR